MADAGVWAVVPAAGRGTRLGSDLPKIMLEVADGVTVWHLLYRRLRPSVGHVHVVVSPDGEAGFRKLAADEIRAGTVSVSVQQEPTGMGNAIFGAAPHWAGARTIVVVWGDQANLSEATVGRVTYTHRIATASGRPGVTLPLVTMPEPYVEYELAAATLVQVRMSREGDQCRPGGLSDVGVFGLSTRGLVPAWTRYLAEADAGTVTGEVNFLPFLPYLSRALGWRVTVLPVGNPDEAQGINTPEELERARARFRRCGS